MKYLFILFLSVGLASCSSSDAPINQAWTSERWVQKQIEIVDTQSPSRYTELLDATPEKIKSTPEFNACMQTTISQCTQSSAMQIAQKNKSIAFCEELTSTEQKESCKFAVVILTIQNGWDIALCESLTPSFRDNCIIQSHQNNALKMKDIKICDNISVSRDPWSTNNRTRCIMNVIMSDATSKESDCKKIGDDILETMCKSSLSQRTKNKL